MAPKALTMADLLWVRPPNSGLHHCFAVGKRLSLCCDVDWSITREARFRTAPTCEDIFGHGLAPRDRTQACDVCVYLSGVDSGRGKA